MNEYSNAEQYAVAAWVCAGLAMVALAVLKVVCEIS